MSFSDDCRDHERDVDASRERSITLEVRGADAALVRTLARRLDVDPSELVSAALQAFGMTESTLGRR